MSVLLRQPDGFEGFLPCPKGPPPDHLAVTQGPNVPTAQVHIDAASHPAPVVVHSHNHGVSYGGAFLDLDAVVGKGTPERFQEGGETRMPSILPRKVEAAYELCLDGWIDEIKWRNSAAPIPGLVDELHDLQVLLRHRPRSIPQAQESA